MPTLFLQEVNVNIFHHTTATTFYQARVSLSLSLCLLLILTYCFVAPYVDVATCCISHRLSPQKLLKTRMKSYIQQSTELYLFLKPVISTASNESFTQAPWSPSSVRMLCID